MDTCACCGGTKVRRGVNGETKLGKCCEKVHVDRMMQGWWWWWWWWCVGRVEKGEEKAIQWWGDVVGWVLDEGDEQKEEDKSLLSLQDVLLFYFLFVLFL